MSDLPYMPLYWGDFLGDTADLSDAEIGAYILLLGAAWCDPSGSLPNCQAQLARIVRTDHSNFRRRRARQILRRFFKLGADGRWRQKRLSAELKKARGILQKKKNGAGETRKNQKMAAGISDHSASETSSAPVDNPVETCGQLPKKRVLDPDRTNIFPNEINGRPMPYLGKKDILTSSLLPSDRARASENAAQQKQEIKKDFGQSRPAAPARQKSKNYFQARAAWEAELANGLGPDNYAQAVEILVADPGLCERATAAEQRQPGAGLQTALAGLTKHARAKP